MEQKRSHSTNGQMKSKPKRARMQKKKTTTHNSNNVPVDNQIASRRQMVVNDDDDDDDIMIIECTMSFDKNGRIEEIMNAASYETRIDAQQFIRIHNMLVENISRNPMLREQLNICVPPVLDQEVERAMVNNLCATLKRIAISRKSRRAQKSAKKILERLIVEHAAVQHYNAPEKRLVISHNITGNKNDVCPMLSDVPEESLEALEVDTASVFKFITKNVVPEIETLSEFIRETKRSGRIGVGGITKEEGPIRCNCTSEHPEGNQPPVPCWLNPDCNCSRINQALQKLQKKEKKISLTTFAKVALEEDGFFDVIGFSCSEECGCKGRCSNNFAYLPQLRLFPTEVFRQDKTVEFRLRAMSVIPAGTPFIEFTGELFSSSQLPKEDGDYAFEVARKDDEFVKLIRSKLPPVLKELWSELYKENWYLNPKTIGNQARFFCHSCEPNVSYVRVFQKGISPANIRLIMFATEDIFPGTELTIDYGASYFEGKITCQCEKMCCVRNKQSSVVRRASMEQLVAYCRQRHENQHRLYNSEVLANVESSSSV